MWVVFILLTSVCLIVLMKEWSKSLSQMGALASSFDKVATKFAERCPLTSGAVAVGTI